MCGGAGHAGRSHTVKARVLRPDMALVRRNSLSVTARTACLDQVMRALSRSALLGIPASTLLVLILGDSLPAARRIGFVVFVTIADVVTMVCAGRYLQRRRRGEVIKTYWLGVFGTMLVSVAWAFPAMFALPGSGNVELDWPAKSPRMKSCRYASVFSRSILRRNDRVARSLVSAAAMSPNARINRSICGPSGVPLPLVDTKYS